MPWFGLGAGLGADQLEPQRRIERNVFQKVGWLVTPAANFFIVVQQKWFMANGRVLGER